MAVWMSLVGGASAAWRQRASMTKPSSGSKSFIMTNRFSGTIPLRPAVRPQQSAGVLDWARRDPLRAADAALACFAGVCLVKQRHVLEAALDTTRTFRFAGIVFHASRQQLSRDRADEPVLPARRPVSARAAELARRSKVRRPLPARYWRRGRLARPPTGTLGHPPRLALAGDEPRPQPACLPA